MTDDYGPSPRPPIRRVIVGGLLGLAAVVLLMLLVRPAIFTLAPPRGDANLGVASVDELFAGPVSRPILLTESHGLLGERAEGGRTAITIIVASLPGGAVAVVNAWSPLDPCAVTIAADENRLLDCAGRAWELDGTPIDEQDPPLQRFAARVSSGAVIADFTVPVSGPGAPR